MLAQYVKGSRRKVRKTVTDIRMDGDPDRQTSPYHNMSCFKTGV